MPSEKFPSFLLGFFPNNCVISLGTCLKNNSSSRCFISVQPRHCFGAFSRDSLREPARYSLHESFGDFCRVSCRKSRSGFPQQFLPRFLRSFQRNTCRNEKVPYFQHSENNCRKFQSPVDISLEDSKTTFRVKNHR